ncbi:hypothetical protein EEB14_27500 [Rhodococcus sp. WS4]|nr:hypothetical protein EEB14_27500 [Rhodococcus sp. WS4]
MTDRDLVDRIDQLVHDQLTNHVGRSGRGTDVDQDSCPHCGREWHGLAITERLQQMRHARVLDRQYSYARDHSRVLCAGSTFIGPMPEEVLLLGGFDVHAAWCDLVTAARQTPGAIAQADPVDAARSTGSPPPLGVAGGCDLASWHCPQCGDRAQYVDTGTEPNAFAIALHSYAAHIASEHEPFTDEDGDACSFAARWAIPAHGVLWDRDHAVIGRFGPGGSAFDPGFTARELRGFGDPRPARV